MQPPCPDEAFARQVVREVTDATDPVRAERRLPICDRDWKQSAGAPDLLQTPGARVIQTPICAPNCNAYAERFVRSIKEEYLDCVIPLGEGHFRRVLAECVVHHHRERNHQGIGNSLIEDKRGEQRGRIQRRARVGGVLNYYYRAA